LTDLPLNSVGKSDYDHNREIKCYCNENGCHPC